MIFALFLALLPGVYWDRTPETAALLERAGIEEIHVPAPQQQAWRATGISVQAADVANVTKLAKPGVEFRVNRAFATRSPWITGNGWQIVRSPETLFYYAVEGATAELAAAEAFVYGGRALIAPDEAGLGPLGRMLRFLRTLDQPDLPAAADIGVVDDGSPESGEMLNMLTRGNLLFRIVQAPDPSLKLNVRLGTPEYSREQAATPHLLAAMVRSNLTDEKRSLRVYGSTVVVARMMGDAARLRVHLLNYGGEERPINGIRVRVLGRYSQQKIAAAGVSDPQLVDVRVREDATEFSIPEMKVYAVVDLFQ